VLFDIELDGTLRRGIGQASKTGWLYLLDRTNGTPLIGIDEQPVPQEPRQATSATQPFPRGEPFVPHSIAIAPEGLALVNGGRIFTPFWTDAQVPIKPAYSGGANWAPSSYDPQSGYFYVCAQDKVGVFKADPLSTDRPDVGERYVAGIFGSTSLPNLGVFALDVRTNKLVWRNMARAMLQRLDDDRGRPHVRRPQRRSAHGARLRERQEALGVPDWRRHELVGQRVRARGQAVRCRVLGGQLVRGLFERRQRLAVRLGRHAATRAAAVGRDVVHARGRRHGRSGRGQDRLRHGVRVLPRRARGRRPRRRQGARGRSQRRPDRPDRQRRPQRAPSATLSPEIRDVAAYVATMLPHEAASR
jgi:hypothetical protein